MAVLGKYFDGNSSKAHNAEVTWSDAGIRLQANGETIFWEKANISIDSLNASNVTMLKYGEFPYQTLELSDQDAEVIIASLDLNPIQSASRYIMQANPVKVVVFAAITLVALIGLYTFVVAPTVGERVASIVPQNAEIALGKQVYNNIKHTILPVDSIKSEVLNQFYKECGFPSNYPVHLSYSNNPMVNAFALPGGHIVVFEGIVNEMQCYDELAALLGHELAHVNQRHSIKQIGRSIAGYLIISALTGDIAGASSIIIDNINQVNQLSNSRKAETEADEVGLGYLREAKLRPSAMVDLFTRLESGTSIGLDSIIQKVERPIEFLSTHPLTSKRIENIEDIITQDGYDYQPIESRRLEDLWHELRE